MTFGEYLLGKMFRDYRYIYSQMQSYKGFLLYNATGTYEHY